MEEIVIVSGARTPIGNYGEAFRDYSASELGAVAIKEALARARIEPAMVDEVMMGCVYQIAEDAYLARRAAVLAGLPVEVPAVTLNRLCGSSLEAINTAARLIQAGEAEVVVAGGAENMSQLPYLVRKARWGYRMGDGTMEDALVAGLNCPFEHYHMGVTAENLAQQHGISRQQQDEFALMSHQRAVAAINAGRFKDEIVPVAVPQPRREPKMVDTDEHPRADTTVDALARLRPAFKSDGTVTAGNSSGICDAAAAVVVASRRKANELGLKPILAVRERAVAGVPPEIMGIGPVLAVGKLLKKTGLTLDNIGLIELNEAFAAQCLSVGKVLELDWNKTNVNGGAVALGHPVGATGCILTIKLMHEMLRRGTKLGMVTLCIGGGQGIATLFENVAS